VIAVCFLAPLALALVEWYRQYREKHFEDADDELDWDRIIKADSRGQLVYIHSSAIMRLKTDKRRRMAMIVRGFNLDADIGRVSFGKHSYLWQIREDLPSSRS